LRPAFQKNGKWYTFFLFIAGNAVDGFYHTFKRRFFSLYTLPVSDYDRGGEGALRKAAFWKGEYMAEQNQERIADRLGIQLETLDPIDRFSLIRELFDYATAGELREIRDMAEERRQEKLEDAKNMLIEEMREKLSQMGIEPSQVNVTFGRQRRARGGTLPVKYRSPNGETWSGRGNAPNWLTALEEQGYNRDEFLVNGEEAQAPEGC
jgi:DNA-binding protein H-NS